MVGLNGRNQSEVVMIDKNNGRRVKAIYLPLEDHHKRLFASKKDGEMIFISCNHGDQYWVLQLKDGVEIGRYNTRYILGIEWA